MRARKQLGTVRCPLDVSRVNYKNKVNAPHLISPSEWKVFMESALCRAALNEHIERIKEVYQARIRNYKKENKEWEAFYTDFQLQRELYSHIRAEYEYRKILPLVGLAAQAPTIAHHESAFYEGWNRTTRLGSRIGSQLIADRKVSAQDAWFAVKMRYPAVRAAWKRVPWPEIEGKRWFERCCAGKFPLAGSYTYNSHRMYTNAYNGAFWKKADHWDAVEWNKHIADAFSEKVEPIMGCVQHKLKKHVRGKQRTSSWISTMSMGINIVMPASLLTSSLTDSIVSKESQSLAMQINRKIAAISQLPSYMQPLFKYWMGAYTAWGKKHGYITEGPAKKEAQPKEQKSPLQTEQAMPSVATGTFLKDSKVPIMIGGGILLILGIYFFMRR